MSKWEIRYSVVEHGDEYSGSVKTSQYTTLWCGGDIDAVVSALQTKLNRTDIVIDSVRECVTDER